MNLLSLWATPKEIRGIIENNEFLQDIKSKLFKEIKGIKNKKNKKKVIIEINTRILALNDSKIVRFDVNRKYIPNCKDIYSTLTKLAIIETDIIAKCISEYAAMEYVKCKNCTSDKLFTTDIMKCKGTFTKNCRKTCCVKCFDNFGWIKLVDDDDELKIWCYRCKRSRCNNCRKMAYRVKFCASCRKNNCPTCYTSWLDDEWCICNHCEYDHDWWGKIINT
eukprot:35282_1